MSMFNSKNLKQLQSAYRKHQTQMRYQSVDNIFYQLCQANHTLGVIHHNKITLHTGAWTKILKYVKDETGLDLACDDVHALGQQDRLAVSTVMPDEKILAIAPTKGFIHVRLLGQTPSDSYIGIRAGNLAEFGADNLIIMENFTPFVQMSHDHLARIGDLPTGKTLLIYRGHDETAVYPHIPALKKLAVRHYIFADYDFAGLAIAQHLRHTLGADGVILPQLDVPLSTLKPLSKATTRLSQSPNTAFDDSLQAHHDRLSHEFLAITQESLMAHKVALSVY